jgi:hypothetical protein
MADQNSQASSLEEAELMYRSLKREPFGPEDLTVMANVFEELLQTLDLVDRENSVALLVAQKVIEFAQKGERDPIRLKRLTLQAFGFPN